MNASELRHHVENNGRDSHFFDRKTMRFFGDTMANFGVRQAVVHALSDQVDPMTGKYIPHEVAVWELYRKRATHKGASGSFYFDRTTFRRVFALTGEHAA